MSSRKTVGPTQAYSVRLKLVGTCTQKEENHALLFTTFDLAKRFMARELLRVKERSGSNSREDYAQKPEELVTMTWEEIEAHVAGLTEDEVFSLKSRADGVEYNYSRLEYHKVTTLDHLPSFD